MKCAKVRKSSWKITVGHDVLEVGKREEKNKEESEKWKEKRSGIYVFISNLTL
jgi:hypothetical protein